MPTISIRITGDKDIERKIHKLGASLLNMSEAMRAIGLNFKEFYSNEPFRTGGSIYGEDWPELKKATVAEKVRYNPTTATSPLIRSGEMMQSFKVQSSNNFMVLFNTKNYFEYHQLGTNKIPQRVILLLTQSRFRAAQDIIAKDIRGKLEAM